MRKWLFPTALVSATTVALTFLLLPVAALFLRVPPQKLFAQLGNPVATDALIVSLKTSAIAHALVLLVGTPSAYLLAMRRFRARPLVLALVELPLILPPAVAGIALFAAFGRLGLLGSTFDALGVQVALTQAAVVLAVAFVESPFYVRGAIAAFEAVDATMLDAARTLGARPARVFLRIALPLALGGLGAASAVALARGLGEFGATIIFAGNFVGRTQTMPLAIYQGFEQELTVALTLSVILLAISFAVLFLVKGVLRRPL